jgi:hypothetical protein
MAKGDRSPKLPLVDISPEKNPIQHRQAVQNIAAVYRATPSEVRTRGARWYDQVHEAVDKGIRGTHLSMHQGAGMVAAVSPNMDWENSNIHAFSELRGLKSADWKTIQQSESDARFHRSLAHQAKAHNPALAEEHMENARLAGEPAKDVLRGMSISRAPLSGLLKAKRIIDGESPDEVMPRRTAPKTNSFARNIAEPHTAGPVTIDGRAHDIAANRMQGWEQGRGLQSADLKRGTSRYEHFEDAYRSAANAIAMEHGVELHPHQVQAVTWEGGKHIEMSFPTRNGQPRKQGPTRAGQPYV